MKLKLAVLFLGLYALTSPAVAINGHIYLGGALDLQHCSQIAGAQNYRLAIFGPGFDHFGVYYPFVNACFGADKKVFGGGGGDTGKLEEYWFYPYLKTGYQMKSCLADLTEVKGLFECTPWLGNHSYIMECEAKRKLTLSEGRALKNEIARYKCVDLVDGPRDRRDPR